jgi:hypothetical protein
VILHVVTPITSLSPTEVKEWRLHLGHTYYKIEKNRELLGSVIPALTVLLCGNNTLLLAWETALIVLTVVETVTWLSCVCGDWAHHCSCSYSHYGYYCNYQCELCCFIHCLLLEQAINRKGLSDTFKSYLLAIDT